MHITTISQNVLSSILLAATVTQAAPLDARDSATFDCTEKPKPVANAGGLTGNSYQIGSFVWTVNDVSCTPDIAAKIPDALTAAVQDAKTHACGSLLPADYNRDDKDVMTTARLEVVMLDQHRIPYQDLQSFLELLQTFYPGSGPNVCKNGSVDAGSLGQGGGRWSLGPALDVASLESS